MLTHWLLDFGSINRYHYNQYCKLFFLYIMDGWNIFILICFNNFISFTFYDNVTISRERIYASRPPRVYQIHNAHHHHHSTTRENDTILLLAQLCDDILYYNTGKKPIYKNFKNNPVFFGSTHIPAKWFHLRNIFFPVTAKIIWNNKIITYVFF